MTELKTLKDLKARMGFTDIVACELLKAEAVKRAKHWKKERNQNEGSIDWTYYNGKLQEAIEANNLTEEDLK